MFRHNYLLLTKYMSFLPNVLPVYVGVRDSEHMRVQPICAAIITRPLILRARRDTRTITCVQLCGVCMLCWWKTHLRSPTANLYALFNLYVKPICAAIITRHLICVLDVMHVPLLVYNCAACACCADEKHIYAVLLWTYMRSSTYMFNLYALLL